MKHSKISYNLESFNPIERYTEVKKSNIHGLGLFAKIFIQKGTIWWHARPQDVLVITKDQFITLRTSHRTVQLNKFLHYLLTYSYYERTLDALIFCLDNSRYVNHSFNANSGASKDENGFCAVAIRDIQREEEITEDYSKYLLCSWLKKYREYFDPCCW
ncbi:MAG: SET domain-containing protein [Candidatus Odinarchaeota archaeon]